MTRQIFVTGTDTDAGKTFCACALTYALRKHGLSVRPYKPIASGVFNGVNPDLEAHLKACGLPLKMTDLVTYLYQEPIAPHIVADALQQPIEFNRLDQGLAQALASNTDVVLTEGAGGWYLPLGGNRVLPQWPALKQMQIVLVVGMKLGCLNHVLLTIEAIKQAGFDFRGYITHSVTAEPMPYYAENLATLRQMMPDDFLGDIPYIASGDPAQAIDNINLDRILKQ